MYVYAHRVLKAIDITNGLQTYLIPNYNVLILVTLHKKMQQTLCNLLGLSLFWSHD